MLPILRTTLRTPKTGRAAQKGCARGTGRSRFALVAAAAFVFGASSLAAMPSAARGAAGQPQDEVSREFNQTVTLGAGQGVRLEHQFGEVNVHTQAGRDVKIYASLRVSSSSRSDAEDFLKQIKIEVAQTSSGVSIRTVYPEAASNWWKSGLRRLSYSVNYDIAMPADAPLNLKNDFGNVSVTGVKAASDIGTGHGSLTVKDLAGAQRLSNQFGSVEVTTVSGDVSVTNNNGWVHAEGITGGLDVRNRFGEVLASNIGQRANIQNGNGNVDLTDSGGPVSITNSFA